jgi:hypothetical protein
LESAVTRSATSGTPARPPDVAYTRQVSPPTAGTGPNKSTPSRVKVGDPANPTAAASASVSTGAKLISALGLPWSPMSSTLIAGETDAILVDTLVAFEQVDKLADWVRGFGKRIVGVYITHGHCDHWIGLARLQEHFPEAKGIATPAVVGRARFEATDPALSAYWRTSFPGELPESRSCPRRCPATSSRSKARSCGRSRSAKARPNTPPCCTYRQSTWSSAAT